MLEKNIELHDVVSVCQKYVEKEISKVEFEVFIKEIKTISYLPLVEKMALLYVIHYHPKFKENTFDAVAFQINMELIKVFKILFAYTNINTEEYSSIIFSEQNYDYFYESGLIDIILKDCEKDYNKIISMLLESISFENLISLGDIVNGLNNNTVDEGLDAMKFFQEEMSDADKDRLVEILKSQDPSLKLLKEQIEKVALEDAKKKE